MKQNKIEGCPGYENYLAYVLLAGLVLVLINNLIYLYTVPVHDSWALWNGDETWLMSQYREFMASGHYILPKNIQLALGKDSFSECSGLLFGSCYITAAIYGLPAIIFPGADIIDVGRTVTFAIGIATLLSLWFIGARYEVRPWLRLLGCFVLASSTCFFIKTHCARYDMLVGLCILLCVGILPLFRNKNIDYFLGLFLPFSLLLNGHVFILTFLPIIYLAVIRGNDRSYGRNKLKIVCLAASGFAVLFLIQYALFGTFSIFGPLKKGLDLIPLFRIHHLQSDIANVSWKFIMLTNWAPAYLVLIPVALYLRFFKQSPIGNDVFPIFCFSYIFFEWYTDYNYLVFVLPAVTLMVMVVLNREVALWGKRTQAT